MRISKETSAGKTTHLWDGANIAVDLNGSTVIARYVRGIGLILFDGPEGQKYYLYNGHGDVVQLADTSGSVVKTYDFDSFGVERDPDPADTNSFRFAGEYFDSETGTYYLRARAYSPVQGRFLMEDPVRSGSNWYAYCSGNPISFVDPWGLAEVGLRAYLNNVYGIGNDNISWDPVSRAATATYMGKPYIFSGQINSQGNMIIDDSKIIDALGFASSSLMVYKCAITGNVSIQGSFNYRGETAYSKVQDSNISYSKTFLQGIQNHWSGTFGEGDGAFDVSTYARYHGDGIKVSFTEVNLNAKSEKSQMNKPFFFGWSPTNPGSINMFTGDSRSGTIYTPDQFMWVSAHEFGHILGVGDMYTNTNYVGVPSIFNGYVGEFSVQESDMIKALNAWSTGRWQTW